MTVYIVSGVIDTYDNEERKIMTIFDDEQTAADYMEFYSKNDEGWRNIAIEYWRVATKDSFPGLYRKVYYED